MVPVKRVGAQPHRGSQCLSPAELGAKDGARRSKRLSKDGHLEAIAASSHLRHVKTGRLTPFDAVAYCKAFLAALLLAGCSAAAEPATLPDDCSVQPEKVRLQLCPDWNEAIVCSDVESTNPNLMHCVGYGPQQHTGNAWCCDWTVDVVKP